MLPPLRADGRLRHETGISDAVDLAWKIAARLDRLGRREAAGELRDERRPIGLFNTREAADNYDKSGTIFAVPERSKKTAPRAMPHAARLRRCYRRRSSISRQSACISAPPTRIRRWSSMTARRRCRSIRDVTYRARGRDNARRMAGSRRANRCSIFSVAAFTLLRFGGKGGEPLSSRARGGSATRC